MQQTDSDAELDTGTTVVGIVAEGGIVLATDRRASLGHMVSSKSAQKVVPLSERAAMAFSGSVSGAEALGRQLQAEISLYETRRGTEMTTTALSTLVGNTLRDQQFRVMPVVAGVDADGPGLFSYDMGGGMSETEYAAVGSGTPYAYGLLEDAYEEGLAMGEAETVARDAVRVASERDTASGNGLTLATVTAAGVEIESEPAA